MSEQLISDARALSVQWLDELDMTSLTRQRLDAARLLDAGVEVDVIAIGKAAREMFAAAQSVLGDGLGRRLIICDEASATLGEQSSAVVVGEHPIPGEGSLRAGASLVGFLREPSRAGCTLFLMSGGASSLCVLPEEPLTLEDLRGVWDAALSSGIDVTTLNKLRASTSAIAGGGVLRLVRSVRSQSLILVDNVISGAGWVASGLTYDYQPDREEVTSLLEAVGLLDTTLGQRLLDASIRRGAALALPTTSDHHNAVLAEPAMMLEPAILEARRRGYRVIDMGADVHGDVADVSAAWAEVLRREVTLGGPVAVLGVGEVTVRVRGTGRGGRCQEFAWYMAKALAELGRDGVFVARASDGRDFVEGVAGAWVDSATSARALRSGIDWATIAASNDTYAALQPLGQLLDGGHTGWNLCDLYIALM